MSEKDKYNSQEVLNVFFIESNEMLQDMEEALMALEKDIDNDEMLNLLFRAAHTIKGSSGMFGFCEIEKFTHTLENVLDCLRNKEIILTQDLASLLLECKDFILHMLAFRENNEISDDDPEMQKKNETLTEKLKQLLPEGKTVKKDKNSEKKEQEEAEENFSNFRKRVLNECWHISLRFKENLFKHNMDPLSFINYLNKNGKIVRVAPVYENLPPIQEADPEKCYLGFEIVYKRDATKQEIAETFQFVEDDCDIRILPPKSLICAYIKLIDELPEEPAKIGELLTRVGALTKEEMEMALEKQTEIKEQKEAKEKKLFGEIVVHDNLVQKPVVDAAIEKQEKIKKFEAKRQNTIRINADKIDTLINLVGELVITGSNVKQLSAAETIDRASLNKAASAITKLIEDIRDSTMKIRMVQIGDTFKKYERVVRDLSKERNKEVNLDIRGGETELDKTLIEKISDPLMHLIRNAVDHGIDLPEEREKRGKSRAGNIFLNAYHETSDIVIEIKDDGCGLNKNKIYKKAVEKGLIRPDQEISEKELFQLIFEPGFSTSEKITNISGRGVGMDVVRKNIESLHGSIILNSTEGKGTTVKIHLPLTLAIIDGFMVKVCDSFYVLPLDMVIECMEVNKNELQQKEGGNFINLRGEVLPFIQLRDFFEETGDAPEILNVIVVEYKGVKTGLVADFIIGEFQTVIKPLGEIFNTLEWISGATILGTGEVAIILDIPKLIHNVKNIELKETVISQE